MNKFAENLKDLIFESGKSLRVIGQESGVPHSQISRYIRHTMPKSEIAFKLAKYFNCSLDFLFGFSEAKGKFLGPYDVKKFFQRYLNLLKDNNTTHWKFSHKYNISESGIRIWKKGKIPKMETIVIIADGLCCSIDHLLGANG